jgi:putative ABC transport system substrate-binding protein
MTSRRAFVHGAGLTLLAFPLRSHAQRAGAKPRIGFLSAGPNPREAAFWQGMRDLGYVDGRTIVVDRRSAEGDFARLPVLAAEIVKLRPDVIVATVTAATVAAKKATSTVPIVMIANNDPVGSGLVANLARPGGNVTGTTSQSAVAGRKLLELVQQLWPGATRVAALWDPLNAISQQLRLGEMLVAAARLNLHVRVMEVGTIEDLERVFATLRSERPDAVLVAGDTFSVANAQRIAELGVASRLPLLSANRAMVEAGVLAAYGSDPYVVAKRSAAYVHKILNGAKPGDLAVELPTKFELVINMRTADALGMMIPPGVAARAQAIIR